MNPTTMHATLGTHVIAELSGCPFDILDNVTLLEEILTEGISKAGATIVSKVTHKFSPTGTSIVFVLSESHLSIHTWPQEKYMALDCYTCGTCNPRLAVDHISERVKAEKIYSTQFNRGLPEPKETFYHEIIDRV